MKKILQEVCRPIPPKCWMTLSVLLSGLSDRPSVLWIPRDTRTSSPCVVLLNVFSWHVIYSWMHHVSRHNTLQETLYRVLPRSSCGYYNIYGNTASLHGSPAAAGALLSHSVDLTSEYAVKNGAFEAQVTADRGRGGALHEAHPEGCFCDTSSRICNSFYSHHEQQWKTGGKGGRKRGFQLKPDWVWLFPHWNQKVSTFLAEIC